jgi:IS605 OrfB family transposase
MFVSDADTDTKQKSKKGKKKKEKGVITLCTSKHRIFFKKDDDGKEKDNNKKNDDTNKQEWNDGALRTSLYDCQRRCVRIVNAMTRALWQADGLFLDNYYVEHGCYPIGEEHKGEWLMPKENLYQLGRRMEPTLSSGITASLSRQVFNKWGKERFEALILNRRSPPHYNEKNPIPLRSQDYYISKDGSRFVVHFSLTGGRHEGGKEHHMFIAAKDSFQRKALSEIIEGKWKRCNASIGRNHRNQWYILFAYKRKIDKATKGLSAGINRGIKNFLALSAEDGWKWIYEGQDIIAYLHRMQARRRSYQYCAKASSRDGRGRKRLLLDPTEHLRGRAARYRETKNHTIARRLIGECKKRGISFLYIEDFSGIRDGEPSDLVGGKRIWDIIQEWPCYDLMMKIIDKAQQNGIGYQIVPAYYISQRCPNCGAISLEHKNLRRWKLQCSECHKWWNLDVAAAMNILARGTGEWSGDDIIGDKKKQGVTGRKKNKNSDRSKKKD